MTDDEDDSPEPSLELPSMAMRASVDAQLIATAIVMLAREVRAARVAISETAEATTYAAKCLDSLDDRVADHLRGSD